jgi:hypothetical protein
MRPSLQEHFTVRAFEAGTVDPTLFDHEAHVYVAWLYFQAFDRDEAIERFDAALQRLTRRIGAADKYDAILTWLFLRLIAERLQDGETWPTFRARNTDLIDELPRVA